MSEVAVDNSPFNPVSTMSWLMDAVSGGRGGPGAANNPTTNNTNQEKVPDPMDPSRLVSAKSANKPFLAYRAYREQQEKAHQDWLERKKERDAKIARGEKVGPLEKDPTAEEEVGLLGILKFLVYLVLFIALAGKFFTGSFTWEYEGKWVQLKTYWPTSQRLFSEEMLSTFDGQDAGKPLYLAIDGDVYDVSSNRRTYGPGGPYHTMAGVDAARSFATGCFATHRTHDLRGLSNEESAGLAHWKSFFADHKQYFKVGRVQHAPIDPASPIPEHCDPNRRHDADPKKETKESRGHHENAKNDINNDQRQEL